MKSFRFTRTPQLIAGADALITIASHERLAESRQILLVTGNHSYRESDHYSIFLKALQSNGRAVTELIIPGEPAPQWIDAASEQARANGTDCVIAVGGGSVLDAGKAVSAMIPQDGSVSDFLEGIGTRVHDGRKCFFVAAPTTSGTGSEATANAVLSNVGFDGFKRSLRHENLVPDIAVLDPMRMLSCPPSVTAASGLDALTQLTEAYVSTKANPLTDALALSGLRALGANLIPACTSDAENPETRLSMAYGAYLSGIVLANAGLGLIHGFASVLGGYYEIPHGVVCGTLQGATVRTNIQLLKNQGEDGLWGLKRYADVYAALTNTSEPDIHTACDRLTDTLDGWIDSLRIPRLRSFGVLPEHLDRIAQESGNKNNPVEVPPEKMLEILNSRL